MICLGMKKDTMNCWIWESKMKMRILMNQQIGCPYKTVKLSLRWQKSIINEKNIISLRKECISNTFNNLTWPCDDNKFWWSTRFRACFFNGINNILTIKNFSEDHVFIVQPWSLLESNEKLGAISVWTWICHGQQIFPIEFGIKVLIWEFFTINRFSSSADSILEITSLEHEPWNDSMKFRLLIEKMFSSCLTFWNFSVAKRDKVFNCFWNNITIEAHYYSSLSLAVNVDVKENFSCNGMHRSFVLRINARYQCY